MLRVLHLIDTGGPGGAETVLWSLVRELTEEGHVSRVILPRSDWLHQRLRDIEADTVVLSSRMSADIGFLRNLMREVRGFLPDIIHAHFLSSGVYGTLASAFTTRTPLVCTFHGIPDVPPGERLLSLKARILSGNRNRVVYVSHDLRRHLESVLEVPSKLGRVIHNGINFSETADGARERRSMGLGSDDKIVGAVGNVRPAKDYPTLLHAARAVCDRRPDVHFVILGETSGTLWQKVKRLKGELSLDSRVHFMGFHSDPGPILSALDIFVSSSSSEGLPLAPIEAMGLGIPVVLTRCGGVPEVVEDGRTGLLVPPGDPGGLADGICRLLENPRMAGDLGRRGREHVRQGFSLQRMVQGYTDLYEELLQCGESSYA